jgi:hypothetical protein
MRDYYRTLIGVVPKMLNFLADQLGVGQDAANYMPLLARRGKDVCCVQCGDIFSKYGVLEHFEQRCNEFLMKCSGCSTVMRRVDIEAHELACDQVKKPCPHCQLFFTSK